MSDTPRPRPRSSRQRYAAFVEDYKLRRLDDTRDSGGKPAQLAPAPSGKWQVSTVVAGFAAPQDLGAYLRWLKPHRRGVWIVFALALVAGGLEMISPLFMRYIVDHVLLVTGLDVGTSCFV